MKNVPPQTLNVRARVGSSHAAAVAVPSCVPGNGRSSIMNVGRRVDYAIRALSYLAAQPPERTVPRSEIRDRQSIPAHFLSKILRSLVNAGLLTSAPGAHGGFRLERNAKEISIREVYESVEGPLSLIECVEHGERFCCFASVCPQIDIWSGAQQMLESYLDKITIGDVADAAGLIPRLQQRADGQSARR
jgi:Rrf2 family protein